MDDFISRQAAITQLSHNKNKGDDEWELAVENDIQTIWKLPPAQPKTNYSESPNTSDCISREQAIDALERAKQNIRHNIERAVGDAICEILDEVENGVKQLPPIQPDNGLQSLAEEIATFKRCVKSENSDYLTGYLCAMSAVEGMIADMREVTT